MLVSSDRSESTSCPWRRIRYYLFEDDFLVVSDRLHIDEITGIRDGILLRYLQHVDLVLIPVPCGLGREDIIRPSIEQGPW